MFADASTAAEAIAADRWHAGGRSRKGSGKGRAAQAFSQNGIDMQQGGYQDPWASPHLHPQAYAPCGVQWYQPMPVVVTGVVPAMPMPDSPPLDAQKAPPTKALLPTGPVQPVWSADPVSVEVVGLPTALCSNGFMEAMLEQAGLEHYVLGYEVNPQGQRGHATIRVSTPEAAVACVAHFHGHRCAHDRHAVMAYIAEGNGQDNHQQSGENWEHAASGHSEDSPSVRRKGPVKSRTSTSSKFPAELRLPSLKASPTNSNSSKPRWADLDDEGDEEDSTSAGTPSATDELAESPFSSASSPGSSFAIGNF